MTITTPKYERLRFNAQIDYRVIILSLFCFMNSSCLSYRLNYVAQIEVDSDTSADQTAPRDSSRKQGSSPTPESLPKVTYDYKYGANYSMGLVPLGCATTFWFYGGFCWFYLGTPFDDDTEDISKHATANLKTLLAGRDYKILDVDYKKVGDVRNRPYYLLRDHDGKILAKGDAPARCSINSKSKCPEPPSETGEQASQPFRAAKLSRHVGSAVAKSTIVDATGHKQLVAEGVAGFTQTTLEIWELKPEGWSYGVMPSYSYRRLNIADFSRDLPVVKSSDGENIPAVISDPQTNQEIDPRSYTNAYAIVSQATSLLLGLTYNSTGGMTRNHKANHAAFDAGLWLSVLEYSSNELHYQSRMARRSYWQFANEVRFDANYYWVLPTLGSAIGIHLQYSHIPALKLPGSIEFRGNPEYNSDKKVFERQRIFVDHVDVSATSLGLSYSYFFNQAE